MAYVCFECTKQQDHSGKCESCGFEQVSDLNNPETLSYIEQLRVSEINKREARLRWIGVIAGMLIVFGLWCIPGFWDLRRKSFAIPLLLDQIVLMAAIAYGIGLGLDKLLPNRIPEFKLEETKKPH